MFRCSTLVAAVTLLGFAVGCESRRHSATGFHLPGDGNVERGKVAFVALGCPECHEVSGQPLPRPQTQLTTVVLGGEIDWQITDGYLTASLIDPAYRIAPHAQDRLAGAQQAHMRNYEGMTVRQLVDIVAFLQSQYRPAAMPTRGMYY